MFRRVMPSCSAIRYTNTPRKGRMITKMIHSTFAKPEVSWRRKRSAKTVIRSQNQITHAKKMNMSNRKLLFDMASSTEPPVLEGTPVGSHIASPDATQPRPANHPGEARGARAKPDTLAVSRHRRRSDVREETTARPCRRRRRRRLLRWEEARRGPDAGGGPGGPPSGARGSAVLAAGRAGRAREGSDGAAEGPRCPPRPGRSHRRRVRDPEDEDPAEHVGAVEAEERRQMSIGPVQMLILGFEDPKFKGEALAELQKLRDADIIRVIDALVVWKDAEGNVAV